MKLDELKYSVSNLFHRKMRSFLSVLSILIGIMAIFALVSFGLGIQDYVTKLGEEAGTDKLYLQARGIGAPGTDSNFVITKEELEFVDKINGVNEISGIYLKTAEVVSNNEIKYSFIAGMETEKWDFLEELFTVGIEKGRRLKNGDLNKVVLGYNYRINDKIFKKGLDLGDKIEINGKKFEIVGFFEAIGNPSDDANIYLSFEAFEALFPEVKDTFGYAMIRADKNVDTGILADKIEDKFRKKRGLDKGKEDFFVQTFEDALEIFGNIFNVINGILVLIALISLVVAAVNIMNTMYTAVIERTNEIGVMKAVGAKNVDILTVFIVESGLLGTVGGIIGIIMGYIISVIGASIIESSGYGFLKPVFPWYLTIGCILFAFFVGTISGLLPAIQASKLQPVDALRYE